MKVFDSDVTPAGRIRLIKTGETVSNISLDDLRKFVAFLFAHFFSYKKETKTYACNNKLISHSWSKLKCYG